MSLGHMFRTKSLSNPASHICMREMGFGDRKSRKFYTLAFTVPDPQFSMVEKQPGNREFSRDPRIKLYEKCGPELAQVFLLVPS